MGSSTIYKNYTQQVENKYLRFILHDIKQGKYRGEVEYVRNLLNKGDKVNADAHKKKLLAFTPSCTLNIGNDPNKSRSNQLVDQYSGFIHLDFDKLTPPEIIRASNLFKKIPYTYAFFISPSGNGIKVFVQVDSDAESHEIAYQQVREFYEDKLGILSDKKCKDIARLCFMSYDPDLYINLNNKLFKVITSTISCDKKQPLDEAKPLVVCLQSDYQTVFEECILFTQNKESYVEGNRNNFIHLLACNCNRKGIPEEIAMDLINTSFDLPQHEIDSTVKSSYKINAAQFASYATNIKNEINSTDNFNADSMPTTNTIDYLKHTPFLPDGIFDHLPEILKIGTEAFHDKRQRDVFLTSALSILSGCMPNVKGIYSQEEVYPNLFCFVIAPAASGKGALKHAKSLANQYHKKIMDESKTKKAIYDAELMVYKQNNKPHRNKEKVEDPPIEPPFKVVFIPANSSYAKLIQHLEHNNGIGIMCETEADTMTNALKQEWGGYSELLRKAFHHETISSSKKTNNEFIEVDLPRISVALSGTPSQVTGLITSSEDGLFSRFMFYAFKVDQVWQDVSPFSSNINLTEHFNNLSFRVLSMVDFLSNSETMIELTREQWKNLNSTFEERLREEATINGDDIGSIVKRLGLITYRIAMIFTTLRKFEKNSYMRIATCIDSDYEIALALTNSYLDHSLLMFDNLPKQSKLKTFSQGNNKQLFLEKLPQSFKRAEAIEIAKQFNIGERNAGYILSSNLGKRLISPKNGYYQKIN